MTDEVVRSAWTRAAGAPLERWLKSKRPGPGSPAFEIPSSNGMSSETVLFDAPGRGRQPRRPRSSPGSPRRPAPCRCSRPTTSRSRPGSWPTPAAAPTVPFPEVVFVRARPGAARHAVLRDGAGRRPGAARRDALQLRLAGSRRRRRSSAPAAGRRPRGARRPPRRRRRRASASRSSRSTAPATPRMRRQLADQAAYYDWVARGPRVPLIERTFAWLDEHLPDEEGAAGALLGRRPHRQHALPRLRPGRRPRLGDGGARPARGRPGVVCLPAHRSSRTWPACSASPGCPTSSGSTTSPPTYERLGPHAAAPALVHRVRRPRYAIVSIRTTKRRVHFERQRLPRRPRRPDHAQGRLGAALVAGSDERPFRRHVPATLSARLPALQGKGAAKPRGRPHDDDHLPLSSRPCECPAANPSRRRTPAAASHVRMSGYPPERRRAIRRRPVRAVPTVRRLQPSLP